MFGGRGISIHDGQTLDTRTSLVDNIERVSAQFYKLVHNTGFVAASNTPQTDRDTTSPTLVSAGGVGGDVGLGVGLGLGLGGDVGRGCCCGCGSGWGCGCGPWVLLWVWLII